MISHGTDRRRTKSGDNASLVFNVCLIDVLENVDAAGEIAGAVVTAIEQGRGRAITATNFVELRPVEQR